MTGFLFIFLIIEDVSTLIQPVVVMAHTCFHTLTYVMKHMINEPLIADYYYLFYFYKWLNRHSTYLLVCHSILVYHEKYIHIYQGTSYL